MMSNHKKEPLKRVVFADDHTRISPRSIDELYAYENDQIYDLILAVYHNTPLYRQFSPTWQQRIRRIRNYTPGSYVEDAVLIHWVTFLRKVLMPMEDLWESQLRAAQARLTDQAQQYNVLLFDHFALPVYTAKEARQGRRFDAYLASADKAREALRWCNLYEKITKNHYWQLYQAVYSLVDLSNCTYLQLRNVSRALSSYEKRSRLLQEIMGYEQANNYFNYRYKNQVQTTHGLLALSERQLQAILDELKSMQRSGVSYDESGELVARVPNSD